MNTVQRAVARRYRAIEDHGEEGITLMELLIVILILGILSTIIVLGVGAFSGSGEKSACETSASAAEAAWAGYYAKNGVPDGNIADLVSGGYLHEKGKSYAFTFDSEGQVTNTAALCGT
jgi:prepilin-type N-terminal cleavage/methylation domain-containing protein